MSNTLIQIGQAIVAALASVNWAALLPSFSGLVAGLISLVEALLGFASTKVASAPVITK